MWYKALARFIFNSKMIKEEVGKAAVEIDLRSVAGPSDAKSANPEERLGSHANEIIVTVPQIIITAVLHSQT